MKNFHLHQLMQNFIKSKLTIISIIVILCFPLYSFVKIEYMIYNFKQCSIDELSASSGILGYRGAPFELKDQREPGVWMALSNAIIPFNILNENVLLIKLPNNETHIFIEYSSDIVKTIPGILEMDWIDGTIHQIMLLSNNKTCYVNNQKATLHIEKEGHTSRKEFIEVAKSFFSQHVMILY